MKLALTVEADAVNVLALNMSRIAVDIDGIELTDLINVVCDNGYSLRVVDEPGKRVVEDALPPVARLNGIRCSIAHITRHDNDVLDLATLQCHDGGDSGWILYSGYGFLLRLNARLYPVLELKRMGLSKACRRLIVTLMRRYHTNILHLDASGERLPDFEVFGGNHFIPPLWRPHVGINHRNRRRWRRCFYPYWFYCHGASRT